MKRDRQKMTSGGGTFDSLGGSSSNSKAKMMWAEEEDEYLAAMGYKVRPSDMTSVAEKLEQLLATTSQPDDAYHLSDTVHYNPSDIDGWLNSMISELNSNDLISSNFSSSSSSTTFSNSRTLFIEDNNNHISSSPNQIQNNQIQQFENTFRDDSEYDIGAIPGIVAAAYNPPPPPPQLLTTSNINNNNNDIIDDDDDDNNNNNKRIKQYQSSLLPPPRSARSISASSVVVVVDSPQEAGIRLVHTLMACAEAVQNDNLTLADALVKQIGDLALSQAGAMRKVATYFAEALARRIYKIRPHPSLTLVDAHTSDVLQSHFYESCPYLKFAHFTANQAILESLAGAERVHVIDFSMKQGMQWPPLIQALARRPGGPPVFRLTGIGPPQPDNTDALREVGMKLAQFADMLGVQFHYRGFVCENLADLDDPNLQKLLQEEEESAKEEVVVVNSVFELHRVLSRPGDMERVMKSVRAMRPKIFTVVEQEANHNGPLFWERFNEALHYYSTMFDSLEGCNSNSNSDSDSRDLAMSEVYLGRQICNVVACEGAERVERHETMVQWRARFQAEGFEPVHLGSDAFTQASMLLAYYGGGDGYKVEENNGCLMLGWHTRPLIATSAWRLP